LTVTVCCGGLTVSNPNRADASSWGSRNSVAANLIDLAWNGLSQLDAQP